MTRSRLLVLLIAVGVAAGAAAAELTIPLSALTGDYEANPYILPSFGQITRTMTLTLPTEITHIESMQLVVTGAGTDGLVDCGLFGGDDPPVSWRPQLGFDIFHPDSPTQKFHTGYQLPEEPFEALASDLRYAIPWEAEPFDILLGGDVTCVLTAINASYCAVVVDCTYSLVDVVVVVNGTVPTEATTWGSVKSLYR
jgi:hypothetical protein